MAIGWLSDRFHIRDRLVVLCSGLQVPIAYAMGRKDDLWSVCVLNVGLWTFGASTVNLCRAIVALNFSPVHRNRAFSWLAVSSPAAFVIGGLASGRIVDAYGFTGLFTVMAACWAISTGVSFFIKDRFAPDAARSSAGDLAISRPLIVFCAAMSLQAIAFQWSEIAVPLRLDDLAYSLPFITSMYSVTSLVSIPFTVLAGRYAARVGNLNLLVGGMIVFGLCRFGLSVWETEFSIVTIQVVAGVPAAFGHSVAAALIAGLGPDHTVGSRMSLLMMCAGVGGGVGGLIGGYLLNAYDASGLLICAGVMMLGAALFTRSFVSDLGLSRARGEDASGDGCKGR